MENLRPEYPTREQIRKVYEAWKTGGKEGVGKALREIEGANKEGAIKNETSGS